MRAGVAGLWPRHEPGHHRRQPPAPVLGHAGGPMPGRRAGAAVPGRAGCRHGLRAGKRRNPLRHRRRPGAGRQAAGTANAVSAYRPYRLRRRARHAPLPAAGIVVLGPSAGAGPRLRPGPSRLLRRRHRSGPGQRQRHHPVHLRHNRQTERRMPDPRRADRGRQRRRRLRKTERRRRHSVLPADGLGWRLPVLVRASDDGRLHRQLSGIERHGHDRHARDRPDLLLRPAAHLRKHADHGDDTHGGRRCDQAPHVPSLHGGSAPQRRRDFGRQAGAAGRAHRLCAGPAAGLRPAEKRAGIVARAGRLHGGRRHRPGPVPLLPLDRCKPEAVLRLDRNLCLHLLAAGRPDQVRQRRPACARRLGQAG